jgi:hypothetical protein
MSRQVYRRHCCPTVSNSVHIRGCNRAGRQDVDLNALRVPLVQHAIGKCGRCGSTLCVDPLGHRCDTRFITRSNFEDDVAAMTIPHGNSEP